MSINDNQLDDIEGQTLVDNDTVKAPSAVPKAAVAAPLTIIPENEQLQGQAVELEKQFEAKLPSMDVTLKLVEGNTSRLVDLEDVEQVIMGDGVISQETASVVDSAFEGLFNGAIKKNHYTEQPSSINFNHARKHMKQRIGLEEVALMSNFKILIDQPIEDAKCVLNELKENYLPHLFLQSRWLKGDTATLTQRISLSNTNFVQSGSTLINLSKLDLSVVPASPLNVDNNNVFDELVKAISILFKDARLKAMVLAIGDGMTLSESQSNDSHIEYSSKAVTVNDLIAFYAESGVEEYIQQLVAQADTIIINMEKIQEDGRGIADDAGGVRAYLTDNISTITACSSYHQSVVRCILNMVHLNYISDRLFSYMVGK